MPDASAPSAFKLRHLPAVVVGNALEFYDFLTYAFFAVHIANAFFPSATPGVALLKSLATFGVGFLTRPLGGWAIGHFGDRHGRKPAMLIAFGLMGLSIVGLALTPPVTRIGGWAPVLAVGFRLLQGFALGGEVGPATAFLVEAAPTRHRGVIASLQSASQNLAILASSLVGLSLTHLLTPGQLDRFGWRIAFLLGALVVPLGLWVRRSLPETLHKHVVVREAPLRRLLFLGSLLLICATVQSYVQTYITTYAITSLHMNEALAFAAQTVAAVCAIIVGPAMAALSDRMGRRRPVLIYPAIARLAGALPIFWMMVRFHNPASLLAGAAALNILGAASPTMLVVIEALPQRVRAGAFGIIYAVMISSFGGTTQLVVQALINRTGNPLAPAWYLTGILAIGVIAAFYFPETAPGIEPEPEHEYVIDRNGAAAP